MGATKAVETFDKIFPYKHMSDIDIDMDERNTCRFCVENIYLCGEALLCELLAEYSLNTTSVVNVVHFSLSLFSGTSSPLSPPKQERTLIHFFRNQKRGKKHGRKV